MSDNYHYWVARCVERRPEVLAGEPCFRDTQLPVATIGTLAADGVSTAAIVERYPQVSAQDVLHAQRYVIERRKIKVAMERVLANPQNRLVLRLLAKR